MTLLKCFGQVDADGKIAIGQNFMIHMGMKSDTPVALKVMRVTGSSRAPYLIVHRPDSVPRFTALQTLMLTSMGQIDQENNILLEDQVMAESGFEPGISLECKLSGPPSAPCLTIRNKGPAKLTTLQEKMGLRQRKRWKTVTMDY